MSVLLNDVENIYKDDTSVMVVLKIQYNMKSTPPMMSIMLMLQCRELRRVSQIESHEWLSLL